MKYIRDGEGALRPYLYADTQMIDFVVTVFGAEIIARHDTPIGSHVEARIDDSFFVLEAADSFPSHVHPTIASVYLYVKDVDTIYEKAMGAGATSIVPPEDKPYEERQCGIKDSYGNTWWIATANQELS